MLHTMKRSSLRMSVLLLLLAAVSLLVWGCGGGGSSYDAPATSDELANTPPVNGAATSVLIEPATLKGWMDEGLVGNDSGYGEKVVIIDFRSSGDDRIDGACRLGGADLTTKRFEGVGDATPLVATGAMMDEVIQRLGIDENSTIVFTTDGSPYLATRAYWTFRYWGFPQERLKVLNGGSKAFAAEYPGLMNQEVPSPPRSSYSVKDLPGLNDDLRASIGELIEIIKTDLTTSTTDIVFDARGDSYYSGTKATSGLIDGDVVVVDGHPEGGQYLSYSALLNDDNTYKTAAEIETLFVDKGWKPGMKVTVYCTSGYSATPLFFAVDAILGGDVQLHDGSWSQTGKYSDFESMGGELPFNSPWAIDGYLANGATYNKDLYSGDPLTIETLDIASADAPQTDPFKPVNNPDSDDDVIQSQVEAADIAYADGSGGVTIAAPVLTATDNVLVDYETLQGWMDDGLVNAATGEKVVILDVTNEDAYNAGHIPGAQLWNYVGQAIVRTEGPAPAVNMVLDGASMDARIQAAGIDENTTIVITSSATATYFPSRAYFLFRYWGFPKDRIKVLNGYNGAWPDVDLTTTATDLDDSTLSVADLSDGAQLDTRVSLAELMDAVRDGRGVAIDFRGDKSAPGSTAGVYSDVPGDYVVFEGRLNIGDSYVWKNFNYDYDGGDLRFKDANTIKADLESTLGIDLDTYSDPIYSYCRTGYIASTGFFVLDGILGVDVMTYDGSWSQWGKMSADETMGGELASGSVDYSAWATDSDTYMSIINYNVDNLKQVEPLNADAAALQLDPATTNQTEDADFEYQTAPKASSGSDDGGSAPTPGTGNLGGGC